MLTVDHMYGTGFILFIFLTRLTRIKYWMLTCMRLFFHLARYMLIRLDDVTNIRFYLYYQKVYGNKLSGSDLLAIMYVLF
jgi:hypothetical protein